MWAKGQAAFVQARRYLNIPKVFGEAPVEGRPGGWGLTSESRKQPKMAARRFERKFRGDPEIGLCTFGSVVYEPGKSHLLRRICRIVTRFIELKKKISFKHRVFHDPNEI